MNPVSKLFALLFGLAAVSAASAQGFEDVAALDKLVAVTLGAEAGQPGGAASPIDRRLKLTHCPGGAAAEPMGSFVNVRCPALGWRIRVPLAAGGAAQTTETAQQPAVALIRRGDPVDLVAGTRGFSVSSQTVAQEDGRMGQRIRVRTDAKSPIVIAEVTGPGEVRLPGFK